MKPLFKITALFSLFVITSAKADLAPVLIKSGMETASAEFSSAELGKSWAMAKGKWDVVDGSLKGSELAADKHAAVATLKNMHTDSAVRFRFQLAGSNGFSLSYNHAKGHLFRVILTEKNVVIRTDKDKKDPNSKSEMVAKADAKLEQGKWYEMICETKGDEAVVQVSNGVKLEGSHAALTKEKTGYRFVLKGDGVLFDDVKASTPK